MFDLALKVCNYPRGREACAFLYTGDATDDGSYNENELIGSSDNGENSSLVENEEGSNETSELEPAHPPERSVASPVTEASNAAALSSEDDESTW